MFGDEVPPALGPHMGGGFRRRSDKVDERLGAKSTDEDVVEDDLTNEDVKDMSACQAVDWDKVERFFCGPGPRFSFEGDVRGASRSLKLGVLDPELCQASVFSML